MGVSQSSITIALDLTAAHGLTGPVHSLPAARRKSSGCKFQIASYGACRRLCLRQVSSKARRIFRTFRQRTNSPQISNYALIAADELMYVTGTIDATSTPISESSRHAISS